jgi:hypothetical protein
MEFLILALSGAAGALVKDVVKDNKIVLPKFSEGCVLLGFVGGVIIGAAVGYLVDQNPTTAFLSGYAGSQMLVALAPKETEG